jgi:hypothetical protein
MRNLISTVTALAFLGACLVAAIQLPKKKWRSIGICAGIAIVALIIGGIATPFGDQTSAVAGVTDSPEPTDSPTPEPCDVQTLRKLDTEPGADIIAGTDPGGAINAAADAENECSRSLDGEQAYRHILAAGDLYLLGIHADDVNDRKGFMQYAIWTVHIVLGAPDSSPVTRAKAQAIIDTANEKLRDLVKLTNGS